jgi:hypothetical protein
MRSYMLGVAAAFMLAGWAGAATPGYANGPYTFDSSGACRDASGAVVDSSLCPERPKASAKDCRDSSGKPESCGMPGAVPASSPNGSAPPSGAPN